LNCVGVMSGAQGSLSGQCGLPGLLGSITAGVFLVSWFRGSSLLSSGRLECVDSSAVSLSATLALLNWLTSSLAGPRYGSLEFQLW